MSLWKKIKKKTNKGDLALVGTQRLITKAVPKKYGTPINEKLTKVNNVTKRTGEMFADKFVNKYKQMAKDQAGNYVNTYADKYGANVQGLKRVTTIKSPVSVSSGFEKTQYKVTKNGLVPVSSSGADETKIATSTLIFGAIALLFLASMMKEK